MGGTFFFLLFMFLLPFLIIIGMASFIRIAQERMYSLSSIEKRAVDPSGEVSAK